MSQKKAPESVVVNPDKSASDAAPESEQIVVASQGYPPTLPLVPVPKRPIFPKTVAPIAVGTPPLLDLFKQVMDGKNGVVGLVLIRSDVSGRTDEEGPGTPQESGPIKPEQLHKVGVICQILQAKQDPQTGQLQVLLGGMDRFELKQVISADRFLVGAVEYLPEKKVEPTDELRAYALAVINSLKDLVKLNPLFKEELTLLLQQGSVEEPGRLADIAAYLTSAPGAQLQEVLETFDVGKRLEKVLELLRKETDISELQAQIRKRIEERMSKQQREFFLREQLKEIKKELGLEKDDKEAEIQRFLERMKTREPSEEAKERIDEEVAKLQLLEPVSPEFNLTRNYLDWLTVLPWGVLPQKDVTIKGVRKVLDDGHEGLDDVKDRIIEFVAAGLMKGSFAGSIICLVGPPGVGKTSVGRAIAASLTRPFYRFSLGGMRDEAEIKGHRRTYIGAMPGKFIQALRVCKVANPVIMLDEIDKIGSSFRGDPASALLEALDPEQNCDFLDHYLDVRFDLSNVLFVCTANVLDTIPPPLRDRMEMIKLSGYILGEKLAIAQRFIVPRELEAHGLTKGRLTITKPALREVIDGYARDPGVRTVEKQIRKIVRKSAVDLLAKPRMKVKVGPQEVPKLLGRRIFTDDSPYKRPQPGVVTGLAWTSMGGVVLHVEATAVPTPRGGFKQTGQLGKVMIESSEIAYTVVRSLCAADPVCADFFTNHFVHLHVPAGATPKDGPSAGITMATSLYTLARGKPIKASFAMTGELTLAGHVMPIGGLKEKVIAARRAKLKHIIVPAANERDAAELPDHLRKGISFHFVSSFDDVIQLCLR
jgi:ATP-dependent Lon protease